MLTTIMKYVVLAALLVGTLWRLGPDLRSYLAFVVAAGAVFVSVQALNLRKYWWMAAFVSIVCLFNPVWPIGFPYTTAVALQIMTAAVFAISLQLLKTRPRLTIASITESNPITESL